MSTTESSSSLQKLGRRSRFDVGLILFLLLSLIFLALWNFVFLPSDATILAHAPSDTQMLWASWWPLLGFLVVAGLAFLLAARLPGLPPSATKQLVPVRWVSALLMLGILGWLFYLLPVVKQKGEYARQVQEAVNSIEGEAEKFIKTIDLKIESLNLNGKEHTLAADGTTPEIKISLEEEEALRALTTAKATAQVILDDIKKGDNSEVRQMAKKDVENAIAALNKDKKAAIPEGNAQKILGGLIKGEAFLHEPGMTVAKLPELLDAMADTFEAIGSNEVLLEAVAQLVGDAVTAALTPYLGPAAVLVGEAVKALIRLFGSKVATEVAGLIRKVSVAVKKLIDKIPEGWQYAIAAALGDVPFEVQNVVKQETVKIIQDVAEKLGLDPAFVAKLTIALDPNGLEAKVEEYWESIKMSAQNVPELTARGILNHFVQRYLPLNKLGTQYKEGLELLKKHIPTAADPTADPYGALRKLIEEELAVPSASTPPTSGLTYRKIYFANAC